MFNKEEITAVLNLLNRQGIKVDITEANAIVLLKNRFTQELMKLNQPTKGEANKPTSKDPKAKAVDASPIIKPATKKPTK